jgi:RNA polymerase sigma factor (TIGR02999 family)
LGPSGQGFLVGQRDVTDLLGELRQGNRAALDELVPIVYDELRGIASRQLAGERAGHTLQTTALVHEAFLKLVGLDRIDWQGRAHFFAVAARLMRQILVDYAERRGAQKRGGGLVRVPLDEGTLTVAPGGASEGAQLDSLVSLDAALRRLETTDARQGRVVECRFFAGMSVEETAEALEVSPGTVKRDWRLARAWLNRELIREAASG